MSIAIYPGSFDPVTLGHLDIISRASQMFDTVYVVIMKNIKKQNLFSEEERKAMIEEVCAKYPNVIVDIGDGLTAEYARSKQAKVIIRGLRALMDFEYELQIAHVNSHIAPEIETIFMATKPKYSYISSSIVKELSLWDADLNGLIPEEIVDRVKIRYTEEK